MFDELKGTPTSVLSPLGRCRANKCQAVILTDWRRFVPTGEENAILRPDLSTE
jgi:hypothetical protein